MEQTKFSKIWFILFGVLTATGVGFWIYHLVAGQIVTDMGNYNYWGINIIMFMFFVGLSAGGLIVASSSFVFNIEPFKKAAKPAVIASTVCIFLAVCFILVDLGSIQRILNLFIHANFRSPLLWDVTIISTYLIINILDIVFVVRGKEKNIRTLSFVALPVAILVHSVTAWIFALQIGKTWFTSVLAPIFVASALDSGLALLMILLMILAKKHLFDMDESLQGNLTRLLAVFVALDAFFLACELVFIGYPGTSESISLQIMTTGGTAPYFWFEIICGLIIPFVLLCIPKLRCKKSVVITSSVLIVLGVLAKRIWLLLTAFLAPYVNGSMVVPSTYGMNYALDFGGVSGMYSPTISEIMVVIGVLSLGILIFMILCNKLIYQKPAE